MAISRKRKSAAPRRRARPARPATKKATRPATKAPPRRSVAARRADFGSAIDPFFSRQPPHLRAILDALRTLVEEAAPEATGSIKWGMPFYAIGGEMMCALGAHRAHVNLILPGAPGTYDDPDRLLEGEGKTGKHLTLRSVEQLPRARVRAWLRTAAARARA